MKYQTRLKILTEIYFRTQILKCKMCPFGNYSGINFSCEGHSDKKVIECLYWTQEWKRKTNDLEIKYFAAEISPNTFNINIILQIKYIAVQ